MRIKCMDGTYYDIHSVRTEVSYCIDADGDGSHLAIRYFVLGLYRNKDGEEEVIIEAFRFVHDAIALESALRMRLLQHKDSKKYEDCKKLMDKHGIFIPPEEDDVSEQQ